MSQSATGQYVITHPPTNTVMVGDDLASTFERMRAVADCIVPAAPAAAVAPAAPRQGLARWGVPLAIALVPFVWLGALHLSLGRLVSELRTTTTDVDERNELRARIERLEESQGRPDIPSPPRKPRKKAKPEPEPAPVTNAPTPAREDAAANDDDLE